MSHPSSFFFLFSIFCCDVGTQGLVWGRSALSNMGDRYWKVKVNMIYVICGIRDGAALGADGERHGCLAGQTSVCQEENFVDKT